MPKKYTEDPTLSLTMKIEVVPNHLYEMENGKRAKDPITKQEIIKKKRFVVRFLEGSKIITSRSFSTQLRAEGYKKQMEIKRQSLGTDAGNLTKAQLLDAFLTYKALKDNGLEQFTLQQIGQKFIELNAIKLLTLADAQTLFLEDKRKKLITEYTIRKWKGLFRAFFPDPSKFTKDITKQQLEEKLFTYTRQTQETQFLRLNEFCKWLVDRKLIHENPLITTIPATPENHEVRILTIEEIKWLWTQRELRLFTLLTVGCGIRASREAPNFRAEWLKPDTQEIMIPAKSAKQGKARLFHVIPGLFGQLEKYKEQQILPKEVEKMRQRFKKHFKYDYPQNAARKTYGTYIYKSDPVRGPLMAQNSMGHSSPAMTRKHYLELSQECKMEDFIAALTAD